MAARAIPGALRLACLQSENLAFRMIVLDAGSCKRAS